MSRRFTSSAVCAEDELAHPSILSSRVARVRRASCTYISERASKSTTPSASSSKDSGGGPAKVAKVPRNSSMAASLGVAMMLMMHTTSPNVSCVSQCHERRVRYESVRVLVRATVVRRSSEVDSFVLSTGNRAGDWMQASGFPITTCEALQSTSFRRKELTTTPIRAGSSLLLLSCLFDCQRERTLIIPNTPPLDHGRSADVVLRERARFRATDGRLAPCGQTNPESLDHWRRPRRLWPGRRVKYI